jgi:hypothetical protein|uniref:Uncharacterized protein n=1 Tax=Mus musculus TaxID=10090 RepID=Q3U188_MOUSE|nr:unnamed protein product [Mus musculus]
MGASLAPVENILLPVLCLSTQAKTEEPEAWKDREGLPCHMVCLVACSGFFQLLACTLVACCVETNRQERLAQGEAMESELAIVKRQSTRSACCSRTGTHTWARTHRHTRRSS